MKALFLILFSCTLLFSQKFIKNQPIKNKLSSIKSDTSSWSEDFENYSSGNQPSSWTFDGNGTDNSTNYIDNTISYEGSNSLKLYGRVGGCWGALAYHPVQLSVPFEVEVAIRNGNETLSGCHPYRGSVGLREGDNWENPGRNFVIFKDNKIYAGDGKTILENFSTLKWYDISVSYDRLNTDSVKLSYWIDGNYKGFIVQPTITDEGKLLNLELVVNEGTAWFDNVVVKEFTNSHSTVTILDKQFNRIPAVISQRNRSTEPLRFSNYSDIDGDRGPLNMVLNIKNPTNSNKYYRAILKNLEDPSGNLVSPNYGSYGRPYFQKLSPNEEGLFQVYILLPNPTWGGNYPQPGQWKANIEVEENDSWLSISSKVVSSFWVTFSVKAWNEPLVEYPPPDSDAFGHLMVPKSALTDQQFRLYYILQIVQTLLATTDHEFTPSYMDFYEELKGVEQQINSLYSIRLKTERQNPNSRQFTVDIFRNGTMDFAYDRAIVTVLLPPGMDKTSVLDAGGAHVVKDAAGQISLYWIINAMDKRIDWKYNWHSTPLQFTVNDSNFQKYKTTASLQLLIGPFQGDGVKFTSLNDAPWIYNYEKWRSTPSEMYWYPVTFGVTTSYISNSTSSSKIITSLSKPDEISNGLEQTNLSNFISNGLTLDDGTELYIPTNTFNNNFDITWNETYSINTYTSNFIPLSKEYILSVDQQLQDSTSLLLNVACSDTSSGALNKHIFKWDKSNSSWKILPSIVDSNGSEITTIINQNGNYRAFKMNENLNSLSPLDLISPEGNNATKYKPTFNWIDSTEMQWQYLIQIDTSKDFEAPILSTTSTKNEFIPPISFNKGSYFWRVRRTTLDGFTDSWSTIGRFIISPDTIAPIITLVYPDSGEVINSDTSIVINIKDNESGIDPGSINFTVDSSNAGFIFDPSKSEVESNILSNLTEGKHFFNITVSDLVGNFISVSIPFQLVVTGVDKEVNEPLSFQLLQNYPNPFNPTTTINYSIPIQELVIMRIYNILGQEVTTLIDGEKRAGWHSVTWNASLIASGVYFYQIRAGNYVKTKKLMLIK